MRSQILALAGAVAVGTAAMTTGAMAFHGGGGGGGGHFGGGGGGGGHFGGGGGGFGGHAMALGGGAHFGGMVMGAPRGSTLIGPRANSVGPMANFANPGMRGNRVTGNWGGREWGHGHHHRHFVGGYGLYGYPDLGYDYYPDFGYDYAYGDDSCYLLTPYGYQWVCGSY
jgi:hypothetical protein